MGETAIARFARRLDRWQTAAPSPNLRPRVILGSDASAARATVWVPFRMIREKLPNLSAMTLDQLGAKMRCDKCGKRPERYYAANQSDTPGSFEGFRCPDPRRNRNEKIITGGHGPQVRMSETSAAHNLQCLGHRHRRRTRAHREGSERPRLRPTDSARPLAVSRKAKMTASLSAGGQ